MKRLASIVALTLMASTILPSQCVFAQNDKISVFVNGNELQFDTQPIIQNGRLLVPFRKIFEALDCAVSYNSYDNYKGVTAVKGNTSITAQIGSDTMIANGETIKLDSPAIIVNGRTLVPLRAVSESLDCSVKWNNDDKSVEITKKQGLYNIKSVASDTTLKSSDGTDLIYVSTVYPVIEGDSQFIQNINAEYKKVAEDCLNSAKSEFLQDAQALYEQMGADYRPMEFTLTYEVTTNRKGVLSITSYVYANTNGAHPNTSKFSRTFDIKNQKEFKLIDVIIGDKEGLEITTYDAFLSVLEKAIPNFSNEDAEVLGENLDNVKWYVTDDSLVMYYNPYEVAPYAVGYPTVEIKLDNKALDTQIDLSEGNLDKLDIELNTKGNSEYGWDINGIDSNKITVLDSYDNNTNFIAGKDGNYTAEIKGISEGVCYVTFQCRKIGSDVIEKTVQYTLYVSKDNKITVLDKEEK